MRIKIKIFFKLKKIPSAKKLEMAVQIAKEYLADNIPFIKGMEILSRNVDVKIDPDDCNIQYWTLYPGKALYFLYMMDLYSDVNVAVSFSRVIGDRKFHVAGEFFHGTCFKGGQQVDKDKYGMNHNWGFLFPRTTVLFMTDSRKWKIRTQCADKEPDFFARPRLSLPQAYHLEFLFFSSIQQMLNTLVIVSMEGLYVMSLNKSFKQLMIRNYPELREIQTSLINVFETSRCIKNNCLRNHVDAMKKKYQQLVKEVVTKVQETDCAAEGLNMWIEGIRQLGFDATFVPRKDSLNGIIIREDVNQALQVSDFVKDRLNPESRLQCVRYCKGPSFNKTSQKVWCDPKYFLHENLIPLGASHKNYILSSGLKNDQFCSSIKSSKTANVDMRFIFTPLIGKVFGRS